MTADSCFGQWSFRDSGQYTFSNTVLLYTSYRAASGHGRDIRRTVRAKGFAGNAFEKLLGAPLIR
jgi:hypothetical protein